MYNKKILYLLAFLSFSLTSCFQILEEISLKSNGSGEVKLTLNLSESKTKLASVMLLDSIAGYKVPSRSDIQNRMNDVVDYLKKADGISNVKKTVDFDNFIATVSFSFKDVANLNNLMDNVMKTMKVKNVNKSIFVYNKEAGSFSRSYVYTPDAKNQYNKLNAEAKNVFKTATYTGIYRFDNEITSYQNKLAKVSPSKKAIMLKSSVLDLINGKINISNSIQLSK